MNTEKPGSEFWENAVVRADLAVEKYGHHDTVEFTLCRLVEEVGELVQAATSNAKGRDVDRGPRILDEATDVVAMVIRLLREWPEGRCRGIK